MFFFFWVFESFESNRWESNCFPGLLLSVSSMVCFRELALWITHLVFHVHWFLHGFNFNAYTSTLSVPSVLIQKLDKNNYGLLNKPTIKRLAASISAINTTLQLGHGGVHQDVETVYAKQSWDFFNRKTKWSYPWCKKFFVIMHIPK